MVLYGAPCELTDRSVGTSNDVVLSAATVGVEIVSKLAHQAADLQQFLKPEVCLDHLAKGVGVVRFGLLSGTQPFVGQFHPGDASVVFARHTPRQPGFGEFVGNLGESATGEFHFTCQVRHGQSMIGGSFEPQQHAEPRGSEAAGVVGCPFEKVHGTRIALDQQTPVGDQIIIFHENILTERYTERYYLLRKISSRKRILKEPTMSTITAPAGLATGTWNIDPSHSSIGFTARHLMITKVRGTFDTFSGTIDIASDLAASSVNVSIDLTSVNTGDAARDGHLKSADFFNVEGGSDMSFRSTAITAIGVDGSSGTMTGDLTIRGITKPVSLAVEFAGVAIDPWSNNKAGFSATGEINRKDWGIEWNAPLEAGGVLVGDKVKLELDIQAVKA